MSVSRHRQPSLSTEAWTPERLEALTGLWLSGVSATKIAERLGGVSRSAVLSKIFRLGLGRPAPAAPRPKRPKVKPVRKSRARPRPAATAAPQAPQAPERREVPRLARGVRPLIIAANGNIYVAPPPAPLPPLRVVEATNPKPLLELGRRECHHPINDGDDPRHGWLYCGQAVTGKGDYCARCRTILFDLERTADAAARAGAKRDARALGATRRVGRGDSVWLR
jgi:GcrA cell cycle regulator